MKELVFVTGNANKVKEIQNLMGTAYDFLSLKDIGCLEDVPETQPTIEGNALQKARYVKEKYGYDCFAEDTGLLVDALDGAPGVYSARYAGEAKDPQANMDKILEELGTTDNRTARFQTVIALILDGQEHCFEGVVEGSIRTERSGADGFGYDPIFEPEGLGRTFAEMTIEEKGVISHRGRATRKLQAFFEGL